MLLFADVDYIWFCFIVTIQSFVRPTVDRGRRVFEGGRYVRELASVQSFYSLVDSGE